MENVRNAVIKFHIIIKSMFGNFFLLKKCKKWTKFSMIARKINFHGVGQGFFFLQKRKNFVELVFHAGVHKHAI